MAYLPYTPASLIRSHLEERSTHHPALTTRDGRPLDASVRAELEARLLDSGALLPPPAPSRGPLTRLRAWVPRFRLWLRAMPLP